MTYRRKSPRFLLFLGAMGGLFLAAMSHSAASSRAQRGRIDANRSLAVRLGLTDLCLFTDARYTRHPAMADLHSPFQDHPGSLEHFPSGSLVLPPARYRDSP